MTIIILLVPVALSSMDFQVAFQQLFLLLILKGQLDVNADCPVRNEDFSAEVRSQPNPGTFYLDQNNNVQCDGKIRRIRYCYHNPPGVSIGSLEARIRLYRMQGKRFNPISDVYIVRNHIPSNDMHSLVCEYHDLGVELKVKRTDVFGVCLPSLNVLPVLSEAMSSLSTAPCNTAGNGRYEISNLTTLNGVGFHIYADNNNIGPTESATVIPVTILKEVTTEANSQTSTTLIDALLPHTAINSPPPSDLTTMRDISTTLDPNMQATGSTTFNSTATSTTSTDSATQEPKGLTTGPDRTPPVSNSDSRALGIGLGVAIPVFSLALAATTTFLIIICLVLRRRRVLIYVKSRSSLARNELPSTPSLIGLAVYDYAENMDSSETCYDILSASTSTTAVYENSVSSQIGHYQVPRSTKSSRERIDGHDAVTYSNLEPKIGKVDGYYCPNAVTYSILEPKAKEDKLTEDLSPYQVPAKHEMGLYAQLRMYGITKINCSDLKSQQHLGSGEFGTVERGFWKINGQEIEVALKMLNNGQEDKIKLLQEAVIMAQFQHPNVLYLYGVARQEEALVVVMELAHRGDLKEYLLSLREEYPTILDSSELPKLLLIFSRHIAQGMMYLSNKGFVHRDLAARNILMTADNICKVADFGMSRDLFDGTYYLSSGGKVPVKWTAPESLYYNKYSMASDVWSYGCVLYEIWSLGTKPYSKITNSECIDLVHAGKRLPPPPGCPRAIYKLMILCWHPDPASRPSFQDIMAALDKTYILDVPPEDAMSHSEAGRLGAPIESGAAMYQDLCNQYIGYSAMTDE